jgi:hypothetical protein
MPGAVAPALGERAAAQAGHERHGADGTGGLCGYGVGYKTGVSWASSDVD